MKNLKSRLTPCFAGLSPYISTGHPLPKRQKCHRVWKRGFTAQTDLPITRLTAAERGAKRRNELRQATEKKEQSDFKVVSKFSSVSSKLTEKKIEKSD
ncbi:hypothetical protein [Devosia soli]|uniref:hypothetical protein n=1 Tax=Devosia soli TaxID=361041 RepID=UPI00128B6A07|nr:hypothetical protein [Devosia soli]